LLVYIALKEYRIFMNLKLKKARSNLIKAAEELDRISKCSQAKHNVMIVAVKVLLKEFYNY